MKDIKKLIMPYTGLPKEIYALFVSRVVNSMGTFVYPLLALILTQKVGFSESKAGTFQTALALVQVPCLIIGGKLVDSLGRKKIIYIFQGLGALTFFICGFMEPSTSMVYGIAVASCFYAMSSPAVDALVADITNPQNRKSAFSLLYMGHNLGFAIGPILGGLLYKRYLSLIFIGDALTTLLSIVIFVIYIKETAEGKDELRADLRVENNNELEKHEEGSTISVLFRRPVLIYFALIMFIYQFAYSQWGFTLPLQMGKIFGEDGGRLYGLVAGFNGALVIVCTPVITAAIHKIRSIRAMSYGGILYAVAFGMLGFVNALPFFFLSIFIMTIGEIMISINSGTFIANHTPASHRGRINSILPLIIGTGYTMGPLIMGRVMEHRGFTHTWTIIGSFVFIGGVLMWILDLVQLKGRFSKNKNENSKDQC